MAYQSWSVVFGEQPSAAKWNILGTNDASFNDGTGIGTGAVTPGKWKNAYSFRAYASGGTTLTDDTSVKIALATEEYDYNNNFASSTYTAPVAGVYHFDGAVTHASTSSTPVYAATYLYKNGAEIARSSSYPANASVQLTWGVSCDILLAANDTVELYHNQNSAGAELSLTGSAFTYLSGHLVHVA